eukprot:CAMPEP_0177756534 /NCGR_PEP_ID=MMETSP0491_2-20121128/3160_1 /TAXON_ID=63592 /ORGANISM="Tetraselmis chuii, Strain PLY429" /LENGTH=132 /DNA_ID=CAMNT_0019272123 /DNA_START=1190 /DNA_END=1584 /DNA_ORIENTATION=-
MRRTSSNAGAKIPTCLYVGRQPTPNVAKAISPMLISSAGLRPTLSPTCPNITPPTGRMKNAAAKTEKVLINSAVGSADGKKAAPISDEKKPKIAKSAHLKEGKGGQADTVGPVVGRRAGTCALLLAACVMLT